MSRSYPKTYHRKTDIEISLIAFIVISITLHAHKMVILHVSELLLLIVIAIISVLTAKRLFMAYIAFVERSSVIINT